MDSEVKTTILVLDDEPIVLKRLGPALEKAGYSVEVFSRSADASARVQETTFDIVITDLKMEGLDGMQFLTQVGDGDAGVGRARREPRLSSSRDLPPWTQPRNRSRRACSISWPNPSSSVKFWKPSRKRKRSFEPAKRIEMPGNTN